MARPDSPVDPVPSAQRSPDRSARRSAICAAALELAAAGGNRAVTHHAIDDRLGIARGSTSYYYRTRLELLRASVIHLATTSRQAFRVAADAQDSGAPTVRTAADLMAGQLDLLLGPRRSDALARYALAADAAGDEALREALANCLFSVPAATALFEALGAAESNRAVSGTNQPVSGANQPVAELDPERAARDLISLLEGLLFDRLYGARSLLGLAAGTPASLADLRAPVLRWLTVLGNGIR
ncbi:TetR/AcrR family transcriptional regulator [Nocardia sp. NPDC058058]|uniref:TetR/AcrR family transcriptional regulator n=1 Tax=Nocardia sp. NPDC058058 TaxID=3346317 RepID=UPI0036DF704B